MDYVRSRHGLSPGQLPVIPEVIDLSGIHPRPAPYPPPSRQPHPTTSPAVVDLTDDVPGIPSSTTPPGPPSIPEPPTISDEEQSEEICLVKVLEMFPDISHEHVKGLHARYRASALATGQGDSAMYLELVIEDILASLPYPTEKNSKRKRSLDEEESHERWERDQQASKCADYVHQS